MESQCNTQQDAGESCKSAAPGSSNQSSQQWEQNSEEPEPRYSRPIYGKPLGKPEINVRHSKSYGIDHSPIKRKKIRKEPTKMQLVKQQKLEIKKALYLNRVEGMNIVDFLNYQCSFDKASWSRISKDRENEFMLEKLRSGSDEQVKTVDKSIEDRIQRYKEGALSLKQTVLKLGEQGCRTGKFFHMLRLKELDLKRWNRYSRMIKNELERRQQ